jgi:phosphonate transport system ATP-binding protein
MEIIRVDRLSKHFRGGCCALNEVSLSVQRGEMVALIGASGSGKSTLLRHLTGLVPADRGDGCGVHALECCVQRGGRVQRGARAVRARVGMIFQQFNLVSRLPLLTNVLLGRLGRIPTWRGCLGWFSRDEKRAAMQALQRVGMADFAAQRASTLSGGQQQRGAIARALVQGAEVLVADEPIASLDPRAARQVMDALSQLNGEDGTTVLVSLHQVEYAIEYCPRTIALRDGEVVYDGPSEALTPAFLAELYGSESESLLLPGRSQEPSRAPAPVPEPALSAV